MKKYISVFLIIFITGFTFFYTEKAVKFARNIDPIMIEIKRAKKVMKQNNIKPIIKKDEYTAGLYNCVVDEQQSYNKMKQEKKYDESLLVMKEYKESKSLKNKYLISGNKESKNISIILLVNKKLDENLLKYITEKNIKINFFVDGYFLENNLNYVKELSSIGNIYNYGRKAIYDEKYVLYDNNLIESISNNKSIYCLTKEKDKKKLKMCNDYGMNMIKPIFISNLTNLKEKIENGSLFVLNMDNLKSKLSINYIHSKGYNIVSLDNLFDESKSCN